jgi:hypothetical protein
MSCDWTSLCLRFLLLSFLLEPDEQVDIVEHTEVTLGRNSSVSATPLIPLYETKVQE